MKLQKSEISILIPTYNYQPERLVEELRYQAEKIAGLSYEIIVGDDGSSVPITVSCQMLRMEHNIGRAAIRNALAQASHYPWLLFLDSDMEILDSHFLEHYLTCEATGVIDGGIRVGQGSTDNLRFLYEKKSEPKHITSQRAKHPYRCFRTTNFMVSRDVILKIPFDERFKYYGYEDVLFGKELHKHNIHIEHIDAPLTLTDFESNKDFMAKTEEGLRTLYQFREELYNYSKLLQKLSSLPVPLRLAIKLFHRIFGAIERKNLTGPHPRLFIYNLYRLGYYLNIK